MRRKSKGVAAGTLYRSSSLAGGMGERSGNGRSPSIKLVEGERSFCSPVVVFLVNLEDAFAGAAEGATWVSVQGERGSGVNGRTRQEAMALRLCRRRRRPSP